MTWFSTQARPSIGITSIGNVMNCGEESAEASNLVLFRSASLPPSPSQQLPLPPSKLVGIRTANMERRVCEGSRGSTCHPASFDPNLVMVCRQALALSAFNTAMAAAVVSEAHSGARDLRPQRAEGGLVLGQEAFDKDPSDCPPLPRHSCQYSLPLRLMALDASNRQRDRQRNQLHGGGGGHPSARPRSDSKVRSAVSLLSTSSPPSSPPESGGANHLGLLLLTGGLAPAVSGHCR